MSEPVPFRSFVRLCLVEYESWKVFLNFAYLQKSLIRLDFTRSFFLKCSLEFTFKHRVYDVRLLKTKRKTPTNHGSKTIHKIPPKTNFICVKLVRTLLNVMHWKKYEGSKRNWSKTTNKKFHEGKNYFSPFPVLMEKIRSVISITPKMKLNIYGTRNREQAKFEVIKFEFIFFCSG